MSLSAAGLKREITAEMSNLDENSTPDAAADAMAKAIIDYLKDNLEVKIPTSSCIVSVTGGSGAPALGATNLTKIDCEIS